MICNYYYQHLLFNILILIFSLAHHYSLSGKQYRKNAFDYSILAIQLHNESYDFQQTLQFIMLAQNSIRSDEEVFRVEAAVKKTIEQIKEKKLIDIEEDNTDAILDVCLQDCDKILRSLEKVKTRILSIKSISTMASFFDNATPEGSSEIKINSSSRCTLLPKNIFGCFRRKV